jgi:hypothetical protein
VPAAHPEHAWRPWPDGLSAEAVDAAGDRVTGRLRGHIHWPRQGQDTSRDAVTTGIWRTSESSGWPRDA